MVELFCFNTIQSPPKSQRVFKLSSHLGNDPGQLFWATRPETSQRPSKEAQPHFQLVTGT